MAELKRFLQVIVVERDVGDAWYASMDDWRELRLDVPAKTIAINTSAKDEINVEGGNLEDPECFIEWIITISALQELLRADD